MSPAAHRPPTPGRSVCLNLSRGLGEGLGGAPLNWFSLTGSGPSLHPCRALPGGQGGCSPAGDATRHPGEVEAELSWGAEFSS